MADGPIAAVDVKLMARKQGRSLPIAPKMPMSAGRVLLDPMCTALMRSCPLLRPTYVLKMYVQDTIYGPNKWKGYFETNERK